MNPRRAQREALDLTQPEAAAKAKLSLATWRRWEEHPDRVSAATRTKCERVLDRNADLQAALMLTDTVQWQQLYGDHPLLTPRQASHIIVEIDMFACSNLEPWLSDPASEPLHDVGLFNRLDLRVMIHVNENRAWAALALERCLAVVQEMQKGVLPFDRPGCFFDEVLIALALPGAQGMMAEMPHDDIPARETAEDYGVTDADQEWAEMVSENFDGVARWGPYWRDLSAGMDSLARHALEAIHPYQWFDSVVGDNLPHRCKPTPQVAQALRSIAEGD